MFFDQLFFYKNFFTKKKPPKRFFVWVFLLYIVYGVYKFVQV